MAGDECVTLLRTYLWRELRFHQLSGISSVFSLSLLPSLAPEIKRVARLGNEVTIPFTLDFISTLNCQQIEDGRDRLLPLEGNDL